MVRDWVKWHSAYENPQSSLSFRQRDVAALILAFLNQAPVGELRILSLCAGDGGDLALALADHPRLGDVTGCLVEFDRELVDRARAKQAAIASPAVTDGFGARGRVRSRLEVRCADAGNPLNFADVAPVDLLMLVGIFGNISDDDIRTTINAVPSLCKPGATVIWSRHRREPDLTPQIREWFVAAGCISTAFVSPGVGFHSSASELVGVSSAEALPTQLFTFLDDLW